MTQNNTIKQEIQTETYKTEQTTPKSEHYDRERKNFRLQISQMPNPQSCLISGIKKLDT